MADEKENLQGGQSQQGGAQQPAPTGAPSKDAKMWAMLCHLGGIAGALFPFGNVILPLIFWQIKKDEFPFVDDQGKEALNFQISISIYALATIPLFCIVIGPFVLGAVSIFSLVMLIIAAIKANNGEKYRYPLCLRLIK